MALTDEAITGIKRMNLSGQVGPGEKLPREKELASRLGLSRSSLREAVRALILAGVLKTRQGDGAYVTSLEPHQLLETMSLAVDFMRNRTLVELFEVRRMIEPGATALAAGRITTEDLLLLEETLGRMDSAGNVEELVEADDDFHRVIAAPAFVEAALRGSVGFELRAGDRQVAVQEVDRGHPDLWLALAEAESAEGEPAIFPVDAPRVVGIVDRGPAEKDEPSSEPAGGLDALAATQNEGFLTMATRLSRTLWVLLQGTVGILDRRLAIVGAMFVLLIAASTLVFYRYLGVSLLDALYFVVVTFATVGYGDINLLEASAPLKVFGIATIMFGALTLALAFGLVTDAIVGARLLRALGQYPVPRRDHVVVCGVGTTGTTIIEALDRAGVRCVAVERDEDALDAALVKRLRLPVVIGDIASGTTLDGLRLGSARALLAVTKDDMANLQCALLARARAPGLRVVLRMFDPDLAARVERTTGIYLSRSVSALAAPAFVAAIFGRRTAAVLPVGAEVLQIVDLTVEQTTDVRTLEETCQARVMAVGATAFPVLDLEVVPGDEMRVVGTSRGLVELVHRVAPSALTAASDINDQRDETAP